MLPFLLLLAFVATSAIGADAINHPARLDAISVLTNQPSSLCVVFQYSAKNSAGELMTWQQYVVEASQHGWRVRAGSERDCQFVIENGAVIVVGEGQPDGGPKRDPARQFLSGEFDDTEPGPLGQLPRIDRLPDEVIQLVSKLTTLGIAPANPEDVRVEGEPFSWAGTTSWVTNVTGRFVKSADGALTGAVLQTQNRRGEAEPFEIRYDFKPAKFKGEFPALIEVLNKDGLILERYEIMEWKSRDE